MKRKLPIGFTVVVVMGLFVLWGVGGAISNMYSVQDRLEGLRGEVKALRDEYSLLEREKEYRGSGLYLEKQARDKLNLIKPGDVVVEVVGIQPSDISDSASENEVILSVTDLWCLLLTGGL